MISKIWNSKCFVSRIIWCERHLPKLQILVPVLNSQTGFVISPTRRQGWVIAFNLAGGFILVFW